VRSVHRVHGFGELLGAASLGNPSNLVTYTLAPVHFVYIVRCADGTLYTGYARDPFARERVHNAGRGARYTRGRRPVALVYLEPFRTRSGALRREYELKRWSRNRKAALVDSQSSACRT